MKNLNINIFDPLSIERACAEIDKLEKLVDKNTNSLVTEVTNIVQNKIQNNYEGVGSVDGIETNDLNPSISQERISDKEKAVVVSGESVLFVEFGTGITKADSPEARSVLESSGVVGHGEYGRGNGANPDGWYLNGHKTMGLNAVTPVYRARKEALEALPNMLKDRFKVNN